MFRFRNLRSIKLYSNVIQSHLKQIKYCPNANALTISSSSSFTTHSDAINDFKATNITRNSDNLREKRLHSLKRNAVPGEHDILSESIIKSSTINNLNELITSHVNVMNNRHLSDAFESINDILRNSDNYNEDCFKLLSSQEFKLLCNKTVQRMRFFQIPEVLTILKTLVFLNVSPNTTIIQSLLQMTRQMINEFSLNEIVFLDFLLTKQMSDKREESEELNLRAEEGSDLKPYRRSIVPLIEALKLAIPLVLQLKIENKELDFDDIDLVIKCLRMSAKHPLKDEVVNKLTTAVSYKVPELSINQCYSVIAALITFPNANTKINANLVNRVINQCLDRVTDSGEKLSSTPPNFLISLLLSSKTRRSFYHKGLFEIVADVITQNPNRFHNSKLSGTLFTLTRHSHIHYGLLDMVSDKIAIRDPDLINNPRNSFTNILQAFALPPNYRPNESNSEIVFKNILESNHIQLSKEQKTKHLLFKILRYLSVLNYYPKEEIRDWVTNYLESALSTSTHLGLRIEFLENIIYLYQGLCLESNITDAEDLKLILKPLVKEFNAFQYKEWQENPKSNTLEFALSQGLGGHQFVGNNMFNDFGHIVDHVIIMRKGGYPLPINDERNTINISELDVPSESQLIGIIPLTQRDYCRQPVIKRGDTEFRLRTLRKSGIITIPVNVEGWESLAEIEKIPFIMREIQENSNFEETKIN